MYHKILLDSQDLTLTVEALDAMTQEAVDKQLLTTATQIRETRRRIQSQWEAACDLLPKAKGT